MWSIWDESDYYGPRWATYEPGTTYTHKDVEYPDVEGCPLFKTREDLYKFADAYLGGIKWPYIIQGPMEVWNELQGI